MTLTVLSTLLENTPRTMRFVHTPRVRLLSMLLLMLCGVLLEGVAHCLWSLRQVGFNQDRGLSVQRVTFAGLQGK